MLLSSLSPLSSFYTFSSILTYTAPVFLLSNWLVFFFLLIHKFLPSMLLSSLPSLHPLISLRLILRLLYTCLLKFFLLPCLSPSFFHILLTFLHILPLFLLLLFYHLRVQCFLHMPLSFLLYFIFLLILPSVLVN